MPAVRSQRRSVQYKTKLSTWSAERVPERAVEKAEAAWAGVGSATGVEVDVGLEAVDLGLEAVDLD